MLLTALGACGRITHDIGQISADTQKRDAGVTSPPDDTLDADGRDQGTGNAGNGEPLADAQSDGAAAEDAEDANLAKDADIDSGDASDALNNECIKARFEVNYEPLGLDIYLMVDTFLFIGNFTNWSDLLNDLMFPLPNTSWSDVLTPTQFQLWKEVRPEISAFIDDSDSEGIGVGINYYGQPESILNPISCDPDTYEQPRVEIAQLPANAEAIKDSLRWRTPISTSPAYPALQGAINHAKSRVQTNSGRKQVVFLMTGAIGLISDADPMICESSAENLEKIAAQGFAESIATYVIGIYNPENSFLDEGQVLTENLSGAAVQGGTSLPYRASLSEEKPEIALELEKARDVAKRSACSLILEDQEGLPGAIDPELAKPDLAKIVVTITDGDPLEFPAVRDHSLCNQIATGWHFDDPSNPTSLVACEQTCRALNSEYESISRIELQLHCPN